MSYLGIYEEDATVEFFWNTNDGSGESVTRSTDGTVFVQKHGALASSSTTAAAVTKANPGVVTDTDHGLSNGDEVLFWNMSEMTELNQTIQTVANVTADTYSINNTSGYGAAETTGGGWVQVNTADVTDTEDAYGITGRHLCSIDASADDYFEVDKRYDVSILLSTIDSQEVSGTLRDFSIQNVVDANVTQWLGEAVTATSNVPDVNTKTITDGIIVAATLGADCITAAKIADDAIGVDQVKSDALSGLDTSDPAGVASSWSARQDQIWRYIFKRSTLTATHLKTYADNDTSVNTTQLVSDDGTTQIKGSAS